MAHGQKAEAGWDSATPLILHASTVALDGAAAVILGASGRGKSSIALQIIALGAGLVADDRTCLHRVDGPDGPHVVADAPVALRGLIEARGVGILKADATGPVRVALVVDLDHCEALRLPPLRSTALIGVPLPLVHMVDSPAFPAAIVQYLKRGRGA